MPAAYYRCQVTIPMDSGVPKDAAVNVWSFRNIEESADPAGDADLLSTRLRSFYVAIKSYISSRANLTAVDFKVFNFAESAPRVPIYEATWADLGGVATGQDLPPEVAACLSFQGERVSGVNMKRRRGRVYLGPLQNVAASDYPSLEAAFISTAMTAADTHIAVAADPRVWCVYSPYTHRNVPVGTKLDPEVHEEDPMRLVLAFTPVAQYWMDNAWDTQRRRGTAATSRTTNLV